MKNMKGKGFFLFAGAIIFFTSCSHNINPGKPALSATDFKLDSLPDSEINIPVLADLRPIYAMAEKNVDTLYTSPNYPNDWVMDGCSVRYKYTFRRSPLEVNADGTSLNLGFTGYYKVIGSTRLCVNGTVASPWTPPCKCGFGEGERKVKVSFSNTFGIQPDYKFRLSVNRLEPKPLNKCEVCFWGQDITEHVMNNLKEELDAAKNNIENTYGLVDLKPRFQQVWDQLNKVYSVYNMGWLQINPQRVRINAMYAYNDSLNIYLGLSAKPVISFEKPPEKTLPLPSLDVFPGTPGFNIFVDAVLQYDSLSNILNQQLAGKEFDLNKGPVKKTFIIKQCKLSGTGNEKMIIKVNFGGSADGVAYFTGKPVYDEQQNLIQINDLDFDVKTRDKFLRTAGWLFNRKIVTEISKYAKFDLTFFIDAARFNMNNQLNQEWVKGIRGYGSLAGIRLVGIYPLSQYLVVRSNWSGFLSVKVDAIDFSL
ncbi:MAG TPA: DUF4403 family protein [Chitinophagaceae bacterium]|nr:DUF4403 family protein [Chitinophagaceae bacterium]